MFVYVENIIYIYIYSIHNIVTILDSVFLHKDVKSIGWIVDFNNKILEAGVFVAEYENVRKNTV